MVAAIEGDVAERGGVKGKRDVACTGLPVSWMPVKFPEYYSVHRSPPRDTEGLSGGGGGSTQGCVHRHPGLNRPRKWIEKGEGSKKGSLPVVLLRRPGKSSGSPKSNYKVRLSRSRGQYM